MSNEKYTKEVRADMRTRYENADSDKARALVVSSVANELGVTAPSVRAVMVREGYYIAKEYKTKDGKPAESKEVIVQAIATLTGTSADKLPGLEKANKTTLQFLRTVVQVAADMNSEEDATATETEGDPEPDPETANEEGAEEVAAT